MRLTLRPARRGGRAQDGFLQGGGRAGSLLSSLALDPPEEHVDVDQHTAADAVNCRCKAVFWGEEHVVAQSAHRRPVKVLVPVGEWQKAWRAFVDLRIVLHDASFVYRSY